MKKEEIFVVSVYNGKSFCFNKNLSISFSTKNSVFGYIVISLISFVVLWVLVLKNLILSTVSPQNSTLIGSVKEIGNISITNPLTENSPVLLTIVSLV